MINEFIDGIIDLTEGAMESLLNTKKNTEKNVIREWVARQSYATSENRKAEVQQMKKTHIEALKNLIGEFETNLSSTAKGEWVDKADQSIKEASGLLEDV